jgi:hypothetical protein
MKLSQGLNRIFIVSALVLVTNEQSIPDTEINKEPETAWCQGLDRQGIKMAHLTVESLNSDINGEYEIVQTSEGKYKAFFPAVAPPIKDPAIKDLYAEREEALVNLYMDRRFNSSCELMGTHMANEALGLILYNYKSSVMRKGYARHEQQEPRPCLCRFTF